MVEAQSKDKVFGIKKWNAVATWAWGVINDTCAICKSHIEEPCIDCMANQNTSSAKGCEVAWGRCNHTFHFHCISRWLKQRSVCPLDNKEWEYDRYGRA
mmetsp:Transcript_73795/g.85690  ORF Transcript_73795/g.85690 Transcript_73795/m.85690 type:complete len:99 (+) Transcript_73795:35-331(+)